MDNYEQRVTEYEKKGCTRSDAQGIVDAEKSEYRPVYIDRRTGEQKEAGYTISLYDWEVISNQIELSTSQTVVQFKKV